MILTVAVVVAVMLTLRRRTNTKYQNPSRQVAVKARDRIRIVKMASANQVSTNQASTNQASTNQASTNQTGAAAKEATP